MTRELVRLLEAGERFALATLIDAHGSTPQKVGARLLVRADGTTVGTLGGGCIEAEVSETAYRAMETGEPRVLDFTLNEDIAVDYGLACGGTERILIDPTFTRDDLGLARRMLGAVSGEQHGVVMSVVDGGSRVRIASKMAMWEDGTVDGELCDVQADAVQLAERLMEAPRPKPALVALTGGVQVFADVFAEPPEVVVVGGGHVGRAVATVAHTLGYCITVIDDRADFANRDRFPEAHVVIAGDIEEAIGSHATNRNSAIVIVTRGHKYDYQALSASARSNAGYIGLMGSRRKVALIYRQLLRDGVPEERLRDIHAPIGLDIGAVSPEEIAVSIMAEITMDRLGGHGNSMRDKRLVDRARPQTVA
ncbi:MAG: XdhC family protein [Chloroflexota bacterium]|nr:XdhC family protein [Chloroflexota bacterium]